jgi:hypothetical protein
MRVIHGQVSSRPVPSLPAPLLRPSPGPDPAPLALGGRMKYDCVRLGGSAKLMPINR